MRVLKSENINYLNLIPFANFSLWDTKRYTSQQLSSTFPIVRLGDCIIEQNKKYKIFEDEEKEFGILGVNNKEGIFDAYKQKGKEINQPYKKMETGWLAYNPYRINVGSIGVKLKEHEHKYISPAYVVFSCKHVLLPEFLFLLFKTDTFNKVINESTTGSVRQNLTFETLKSLEIPLPSIEVQNEIIAAYQEKIQLAEQQAKQANELEAEIERYLMEELGVETQENNSKRNIFQLVNFTELNRWDSLYLLGNLPIIKSNYKLVKFSDVIQYFNKGINGKPIRIDSSKFPNQDFRYIGMEHIEKESGILLEMLRVKGNEIKSQTLRVPIDFIIYGKLRPYLNKYWINNTDFEDIICSSEFFVFDINESIDKEFFKYVLSSKIIQAQISDKTSGARMPRINEEIFFNLQFPLPPKSKQIKVSNYINSLKNKKTELNIETEKLKIDALKEFENIIFS